MSDSKNKFSKLQKITGSTFKKANEKMKELGSQTSEFLEEQRESDKFEKAQEKANLVVKDTGKKLKKFGKQTNEFLEERKESRDESKRKLDEAQEKTDSAVRQANIKIEELGNHTDELFQGLSKVQIIFDLIRNVPTDKKLELAELKKVRLNWKNQAEKIEKDYEMAAAKGAGVGALGAGTGVAVAALGSSVAMGIATTFGVASTGTAISALSGAAATNAALAWLGGGALAAGGGGIIAGNILLALTGPLGWTVAGVAMLSGSGLFLKARNEKEQLESIFTAVNIRDAKSYELSMVELNERIVRIKNETKIIQDIINEVRDFGLDYNKMGDHQQYELGTFVNFMNSSTQLLVNPILGLQPKYSQEDYLEFLSSNQNEMGKVEAVQFEEIIIFLANLLYKIELTDKDKKIIWKTITSNKELMESMKLSKKDFKESIIDQVDQALNYKYQLSKY